jgi:hypothetical protein
MRIDPKYFNKFMLAVATVCLLTIIYFNFYYQQRQFSGVEERIGDGSVLTEAKFSKLFTDDEISLSEYQQQKMIIFWATWSERAGELARLISENRVGETVLIISAVVRDSPDQVQQSVVMNNGNFIHVDGTPLYNELMIPGIPSIFIFGVDNRMLYSRIGYRESRDYDELMGVLR